MVVVIVFHGFIYQAKLTPDGLKVVGWAPPAWVFALTWVLMAIPMFFICGGFANALAIHKVRTRGLGLAHYFANRGRRLTGGLMLYIVCFTVVASLLAWVYDAASAVQFSLWVMRLLWFLTVYLAVIMLAPMMVFLHDRFGIWVMVVLMGLIAVVDRWALVGNPLGQLNMLLVWALCHQFGIAYQRGWFRHGPIWQTWIATVCGAAGVVVLIFGLGYPSSAVVFANMPVANHLPPTLAMAFLGLFQAGMLGLVERSQVLQTVPKRVASAVSYVNALVMTIYLWHVPCLVIGGGVLLGISLLYAPASGLLLSSPMVVAAGMVLVVLLCPLIVRLEVKLIPPLGSHPDRILAVVGMVLLLAGTQVARAVGLVLHPSSLGGLWVLGLVLLGCQVLAWGADPARLPSRQRLARQPDSPEMDAETQTRSEQEPQVRP